MSRPLKVILLEDEADDAELLVRELTRAGFAPNWVRMDTEDAFLAALSSDVELVISDFKMPQLDALRALDLLQASGFDIPFILISGTIGEETAVTVMKQGAADYLLKDRLGRLAQAVTRALEAAAFRTQRRLSETALRQSENLFRSTLENMMEGCQIIGRDWRYRYVNGVAARHGRCTVAALQGRKMQEMYPGIEHTPVFAAMMESMTTGVAREVENEFQYADGGAAWFQLVIQPVPEGLFVLSLDITARKRAEDALHASENRFRELLENVDLIAMTLDRDGCLTFSNEYLRRLTGWRVEELAGADWFKTFIPTADSDLKRGFLDEIALGRIAPHRENPIKTKSGELREITWNNTLLRDATGAVRGSASIGQDITESKAAAVRIKEQLAELRRWQEVTLEREDRVLALKLEVNELLNELNRPARYGTETG